MDASVALLENMLLGSVISGEVARDCGRVIVRDALWEHAMRLAADNSTRTPNARTAFHAAWALEHACFGDWEAFAPFLGRFLSDFTAVRNPGVHRHYTKILVEVLRRGALPEGAATEAIAERCFDFLIDPDVRVGVKVWAMDALELLAPRVEWVGEHLREIVGRLMDDGSPAILSRGRKLMRRLRRPR